MCLIPKYSKLCTFKAHRLINLFFNFVRSYVQVQYVHVLWADLKDAPVWFLPVCVNILFGPRLMTVMQDATQERCSQRDTRVIFLEITCRGKLNFFVSFFLSFILLVVLPDVNNVDRFWFMVETIWLSGLRYK